MPKTVSLLSALLCTFIWGTTFIAQDTGMDDIGPFTFNAVRFFVGFIAILPYSTKNWVDFFTMMNRPELAELEIVRNPIKRSENINTLYEKLYEIAPEKTTDEWCELLRDANIPHTRVNHLDDLLEDPHLKEVGLFEEYQHPSEGPMRQVRSHYRMSEIDEFEDKPTQLVGQSTHKILSELGYSEEQIKAFAELQAVKIA